MEREGEAQCAGGVLRGGQWVEREGQWIGSGREVNDTIRLWLMSTQCPSPHLQCQMPRPTPTLSQRLFFLPPWSSRNGSHDKKTPGSSLRRSALTLSSSPPPPTPPLHSLCSPPTPPLPLPLPLLSSLFPSHSSPPSPPSPPPLPLPLPLLPSPLSVCWPSVSRMQ